MSVNTSDVRIFAKTVTVNTNISLSRPSTSQLLFLAFHTILSFVFSYIPFSLFVILFLFISSVPSRSYFLLHNPCNLHTSVNVTTRQHDRQIAYIGNSRSYYNLYNVHTGSRSHPVANEGFLSGVKLSGFEAVDSLPSSAQVQNSSTWSCA